MRLEQRRADDPDVQALLAEHAHDARGGRLRQHELHPRKLGAECRHQFRQQLVNGAKPIRSRPPVPEAASRAARSSCSAAQCAAVLRPG